jgi:putative addiction module CopG family antidote
MEAKLSSPPLKWIAITRQYICVTSLTGLTVCPGESDRDWQIYDLFASGKAAWFEARLSNNQTINADPACSRSTPEHRARRQAYLETVFTLLLVMPFTAEWVHGKEMGFDKRRALLDFSGMEITLPKKLQQFVARKVRDGGYADASEVVREALRDFHAKEDPAEQDSRELAALLLPAVAGSHRRVMDKDFERLRKRARRKPIRP